MDNRNGYMLKGRLARRGYDWWWHSMVAHDRETGEPQPFFIAYLVINPALGGSCQAHASGTPTARCAAVLRDAEGGNLADER